MIAEPITKMAPALQIVYNDDTDIYIFLIGLDRYYIRESSAVGLVVITDRQNILGPHGWYTPTDAGLYRVLHFAYVEDAEEYVRELAAWEKLG